MTTTLIEDPILRQRYTFERVAGEDGEDLVRVEVWVDPGGGVVPHIHPLFEERFAVLDGEVTFEVDGERIIAVAGESALVPAGATHTYRNESDRSAHMTTEVRPGHPDLQGFLEDAAALGRAGMNTRRALPKRPQAVLYMAVMARHYRDTTRIVSPPVIVQRLFLDPFAALGKRRGIRAGRFAARLGV